MSDDLKPSSGLFPHLPVGTVERKEKPLSRVKSRLIDSSVAIQADDPETVLYQHSVFCQTSLPYRDPGQEVRVWERRQGAVSLRVEAGAAQSPNSDDWIELGLPWGAKPRLILAHLNAEALRTGSPLIEVEGSLTAFVKRIRLDPKGRNMRLIKDQLARLSASTLRLGIRADGRAVTIKRDIVSAFDLWFPKDERQRVLWPSTIRLSQEYFDSLQKHAVPLDDRAVAALSHSAMGLDIYAWLAQRLHRVDPHNPQLVSWEAVKAQFGWHYGEMYKFKQVFRKTLGEVATQYRAARIEMGDEGLTLRHSPPPIKGRIAITSNP
jgi:hypothetical protein